MKIYLCSMKKSICTIWIIITVFSLAFSDHGKDKKLKNNRIEEIIKFPKHVSHLKKLKTHQLKIEKNYYANHERNYYLICKNVEQTHYKKAIFYVHGGGWILGKPENHLKLAELLSEQGFVVILTSYRYAYQTSGIEMVEDLKKAYYDACITIKEKFPEVESVIIGGASAGGNLASLLALSNLDSLLPIKGLFSLSGVLDLSEIKYNAIIKIFAKEPNSLDYHLVNPISYLSHSKGQFPILCIHGTQDGLVPVCSSSNFVEVAKNKSCHSVEIFYFQANHIDITSAWYYDTKKNYGQKEVLLSWLLSL